MFKNTEELSQVSSSASRRNLTAGSDQVEALVAGADPEDSGKGQLNVLPLLTVEGVPLTRSASNASLTSVESCRSAFSNASAADFASCNEDREECVRIRKEEEEYFTKMVGEVTKMLAQCEKQKNVGMSIKEGLKNLKTFIDEAKAKHEEANEKEESFHRGLKYAQEGRQYRRTVRERIQTQMIRRIAQDSKKRSRSPTTGKDARGDTFAEKVKSPKAKKRKEAAKTSISKVAGAQKGPTTSSMVVRVAQGQTFADVLGKLKKEVDPGACQTTVVGARPTKEGNLLLKLGRDSNRKAFAAKVSEAVKGIGTVRVPEDQRITLEIRDLDGLTDREEVVSALREALQTPPERRQVTVLGPNKQGVKLAVVVTDREEADRLEKLGRLKLGFMSCPIRRRLMVIRCHKCLGYGHKSMECKGADRSSACFKCGKSGHCLAECTSDPCCFLCKEDEDGKRDTAHYAGSGKCLVFRRALQDAKRMKVQDRRKFQVG